MNERKELIGLSALLVAVVFAASMIGKLTYQELTGERNDKGRGL